MIRRTCLLTVALTLCVSPARAATPTAVVTAVGYHYAPGDITQPTIPLRVLVGTTMEFAPADAIDNHSIISVEYKDGAPLFASPLIGVGQVAEVAGVDHLGPGVYQFTCQVHFWMAGEFEIAEQL